MLTPLPYHLLFWNLPNPNNYLCSICRTSDTLLGDWRESNLIVFMRLGLPDQLGVYIINRIHATTKYHDINKYKMYWSKWLLPFNRKTQQKTRIKVTEDMEVREVLIISENRPGLNNCNSSQFVTFYSQIPGDEHEGKFNQWEYRIGWCRPTTELKKTCFLHHWSRSQAHCTLTIWR